LEHPIGRLSLRKFHTSVLVQSYGKIPILTLFFLISHSFWPTYVSAAKYVITFDDPKLNDSVMHSGQKIDNLIRTALKSHSLRSILFVSGHRLNTKEGAELLEKWDKEGHWIGNHTYSHTSIDDPKINASQFIKDLEKQRSLIQHLNNYRPVFRYPFLKMGSSLSRRNAVHRYLQNNKIKHGFVTVDTSDWYISHRLEEALKNNPNLDLTPYRMFYQQHILERLEYYDQLAKKHYGTINHSLLLHHNLINGLFLNDLIVFLKTKGWEAINVDSVFNQKIESYLPPLQSEGSSIIWSLAKQKGEKGLRHPPEHGSYEKVKLDQQGL